MENTELIERLVEWGVDWEDLKRCVCGNDALALRLVMKVPQDNNYKDLEGALQRGDLEGAFQGAHGLKGVVGNLSLTPLHDPVWKITELLRPRETMEGADILLAQIKEKYEELLQILEG